jgi:hypothetical protein
VSFQLEPAERQHDDELQPISISSDISQAELLHYIFTCLPITIDDATPPMPQLIFIFAFRAAFQTAGCTMLR